MHRQWVLSRQSQGSRYSLTCSEVFKYYFLLCEAFRSERRLKNLSYLFYDPTGKFSCQEIKNFQPNSQFQNDLVYQSTHSVGLSMRGLEGGKRRYFGEMKKIIFSIASLTLSLRKKNEVEKNPREKAKLFVLHGEGEVRIIRRTIKRLKVTKCVGSSKDSNGEKRQLKAKCGAHVEHWDASVCRFVRRRGKTPL